MNTEIQRSLITKFRKTIYRKVVKAIETYNLIEPNDKIAVCISGGKDSMLLAICIQELQAHGPVPFEAVYISMNPGYNDENLQRIKDNAKLLDLDIEIFNTSIFDYATTQDENPCYICARMRRGYLYNYALKLGCNKIALGHHADDVIETTMMGIFYSNEITFMRPKLRSKNFGNMELIRPLYMVKEEDILKWKKYHNLEFIGCACPLTKNIDVIDSKRKEVKEIIKELKKYNDEVDDCIFRSIHNINLGTIVGVRKDENRYSFNDIYEIEGKKDAE